jgi:excisionase family DNA binding protein
VSLSFLSPDAMAELERYVQEQIREALVTERAKRWMSVRETADYLGVSEAAVRRRILRGRIPVKHHGRAVLVDRVALDRKIEAA